MRKEFGKVILELTEKDKSVYLLTGDIGYAIFDEFREKFPDRFFRISGLMPPEEITFLDTSL